jgi:WhiB family transcriptional regulator, redox-sensing transcriptional regulator
VNGIYYLLLPQIYNLFFRRSPVIMDWRHESACRDEDPERFFPVGNTGPALAQIEEAKKVCNRCIVKEPCLAWALESGQDAGVWGGLSEDERRALKRRAARNRARMLENQNSF